MLCVDLHCHSTASDGLLPACDVARRAVGNGVNMLALTDHDDLGGLEVARSVAEASGVRFINGVEVSIEWGGIQIHVLGLNFNADDEALNSGLASIRAGRVDLARSLAEALDKIGIEGGCEGAVRYADHPNVI